MENMSDIIKFDINPTSVVKGDSLKTDLGAQIYTSIAVIGSAGRKGDKELMSLERFDNMVKEAETIINQHWGFKWDNVELVSGSASWADHVAVALYLKHQPTSKIKLTLHMPCKWDTIKKKFQDTGSRDWKSNPGGTSNYYHGVFSKVIGRNSLEEIDNSLKLGAACISGKGFHDRDDEIAKSQYMVAFGFHGTIAPGGGGTKYTWTKSRSRNKKYVNILSIKN